jgi:hypothetical protein
LRGASFWRFICGRIITKYSTTNISTSGSMLMSDDNMSPPPEAAGAVWAKAEEMNKRDSSREKLECQKRGTGPRFRAPWKSRVGA